MSNEITWNEQEFNAPKKGQKGFVSKDVKRSKLLAIRLTDEQDKVLEVFCKEQRKTKTDVVREAIYLYLVNQHVNPDSKKESDPRQFDMFK